MHHLLQHNSLVAITNEKGLGGVGKTELAVQYSRKYLADYPGGVCWLFPKELDLGMQLVEFAQVQFHPFNLPESLRLNSQVSYCWRYWPAGQVLVVIDDVTDYQQIEDFLSLNDRFKVLITTRQRFRGPLAQLSLGVLTEDDALALLAAWMGNEWVSRDPTFAQKLCKQVGYLPLTLNMVVNCLQPEGVLC